MTDTDSLGRRLSLALAPLLLLSSSALGQKIHDIHLGEASQENLGFSVALIWVQVSTPRWVEVLLLLSGLYR